MPIRPLQFFAALGIAWPSAVAAGVVINEIHYDADPKTAAVEFVELHNTGDRTEHLGGWYFSNGIDFTFAANTALKPGGYLVIAENPAKLRAEFRTPKKLVLGPYIGRLSNGETLTLRNDAGEQVDRVNYDSGFPWPTAASGAGSSMELIHPSLDNDLGGSWRSAGMLIEPSEPVVLLAAGRSGWSYREGTSEASSPRSAWRQLDFDEDASWKKGTTPIGYGDGDDKTEINMRNRFTSVYLRREFAARAEVPSTLLLRVYVDDGAVVWLNGEEVARVSVPSGVLRYNSLAKDHEAKWEEVLIQNAREIVKPGRNIIAIHGLNATRGSSDFSIDAELRTSPPGQSSGTPTPGSVNTVFSENAPPQTRQVKHEPQQPKANEPVRISVKVTDPEGVASVKLSYQSVAPGRYVRLTDGGYEQGWRELTMNDAGENGDATAEDSIYSATVPRAVQQHRTLVRYRVRVEDNAGNSVALPYGDDDQPNFAYFCYNGVPAWSGSNKINGKKETFSASVMRSLPTYHLIADGSDVNNSQYNSAHDTVRFKGTLVYDGRVYDHVEFRNRGEYSTYVSGKNKWRLYFNRARGLRARDNYGRLYQTRKKTINLNGCAAPWMPVNRGMAGMEEAIGFKLYSLAGGLAPHTDFIHFRVIDDTEEAPTGRGNAQYSGDLWGLYLHVEHTDSRFLAEHGLPDGNVYKIERNEGDRRNQGATQPSTPSDWNSFRDNYNRTQSLNWWRQNLHMPTYYTFRSINRIISNVDLRDGWNHVCYHNPDGHWYPVPWDLDMLIIPETHWQGAVNLEKSLRQYRTLKIEFKNRARELMDLLVGDASPTGGQIGQFIDEQSRFINPPGQSLTFVDVDQFMWNYHPRTASNHRGQFYVSPKSQNNIGGTWTRRLKSKDFEGMMQHMLDFMTDTDTGRWRIGDGDPKGYGFNYLEYEAKWTDIPDRPEISYSGPEGFPLNELQFKSTPFSPGLDKNNQKFTGIQWRLAEISNPKTPYFELGQPWKYEIQPVWEMESDEFVEQVAIPQHVMRKGGTYRARVRMRNGTHSWSRWSAPVEFVAGEPDLARYRDSLAFSEIMYHPQARPKVSDSDYEFLEIKNTGERALDLSGLFFSSGIRFIFSQGSTLAPGKLFVLARNKAALEATHPGLKVNGVYEGRLANQGETLTLAAGHGATVLSLTYSDQAPWPTKADGEGYSLVADGVSETGYRASAAIGGTPGSDPAGEVPAMKLTIDRLSGDRVRLTFEAEGGVTYTLLATDALGQAWESLARFEPNVDETVTSSIALGQARHRFFKLVSPVKP